MDDKDIPERIGKLLSCVENLEKRVDKLEGESDILFKKNTDIVSRLAIVTEKLETIAERLNKPHPLSNLFWVVLGGVVVFLITKIIELI